MSRLTAPLAGVLLSAALVSAAAAPAQAADAPTRPVLRVASAGLVWGDVAVGTTSATRVLIVGNGGPGVLPMGRSSVAGLTSKDFTLVTDECAGKRLASGQTCALTVAFSPTAPSTRLGQLAVRTTYDDCRAWVPVAGSGTAVTGPDLPGVPYGFASQCMSAPEAVAPAGTGSATTTTGTTTTAPTASTPQGGGIAAAGGVLGSSQSGAPACVSARRVRIHVTPPSGERFRAGTVRVTFRGTHVAVRRAGKGRYSALLDFKGLAKGRYAVKARGTLESGARFRRTRHFVTCLSGKSPA